MSKIKTKLDLLIDAKNTVGGLILQNEINIRKLNRRIILVSGDNQIEITNTIKKLENSVKDMNDAMEVIDDYIKSEREKVK